MERSWVAGAGRRLLQRQRRGQVLGEPARAGPQEDLLRREQHGVLRLARTMYASEGPSAFFRGVKPRLLHKVPSSTLFWMLYEAFRKLLRADDVAV